jgi:uncharacterized repeat protein (TIGR03803 family)
LKRETCVPASHRVFNITGEENKVKTLRSVAVFAVAVMSLAGIIIPVPAHAQTFKTLYSFTGAPDGSEPFQSNLLLVNNALVGTTGLGGTFNDGTIFKIAGTGKETVLYSFSGGADGNQPSSGLIRDSKGNLYGTTFWGGNTNCILTTSEPPGCGTVYKLSTTGTLTVLYAFNGGTDGAWPQGLALDNAGNLYGVTFYGGNLNCPIFVGFGCGVVFKISAAGTFSVLYTFQGGADGGIPYGFLSLRGSAVYGGTQAGGNLADCGGIGCGVVFSVSTASGAEKSLYAFTGGKDGSLPTSQYVWDVAGNLYGTAYAGGLTTCSNQNTVGCGVIFRLSPTGKETVLYTFKGAPDGANPSWGLTVDSNGNGYGTTLNGGSSNLGAIFELSSKGVETVLHSFNGTDGVYPQSGLVSVGTTGFYSNTVGGGDLSCNSPNGCGTIFRIVP